MVLGKGSFNGVDGNEKWKILENENENENEIEN